MHQSDDRAIEICRFERRMDFIIFSFLSTELNVPQLILRAIKL